MCPGRIRDRDRVSCCRAARSASRRMDLSESTDTTSMQARESGRYVYDCTALKINPRLTNIGVQQGFGCQESRICPGRRTEHGLRPSDTLYTVPASLLESAETDSTLTFCLTQVGFTTILRRSLASCSPQAVTVEFTAIRLRFTAALPSWL